MNEELIQKLLDQSYDCHGFVGVANEQKFAKLIIQECIKSIEKNFDDDDISGSILEDDWEWERGYNSGLNAAISSIQHKFREFICHIE